MVDHKEKLKEWEKTNKHRDLAKEKKALCNIMVMAIPIVIGALGTIPKGPANDLEDLDIKGQEVTI